MPAGPAECRKGAAECERIATTAISEHAREIMRHLAARWHDLAEEDEARAEKTHKRTLPADPSIKSSR